MKDGQKVYFQCGYEDDCKEKKCMTCKKKIPFKHKNLTLAEAICVEDFAVGDIKWWIKNKPEELHLAQKAMFKLMRRMKW